MTTTSSSPNPVAKKKMFKNPVLIGTIVLFIVYFAIVALGFAESISEKWMERIDIICLIVALIAYVGDTSGFYEKKPGCLPAARTLTLGTISLSLSIHLFTYKNVESHFTMFAALGVVLAIIGVSALIYKGINAWLAR